MGIGQQATANVIRERARHLIAAELGVDLDRVTDAARWGDDLGADSLDRIELVLAVEEAFDVTIDDDAIETFATVGDLIAWLEKSRCH
jgi:acyl carrier protein